MSSGDTPPYRDATAPTDQRVADLLDRMTLEEKAGQLVGTWEGQLTSEKTVEDIEREVREDGVGNVSPFGIGCSTIEDPEDAAAAANRLQEVAVEETRLGIPLSIPVDAIHGHAYVAGTTVFPHGLGMAATRNPALVERGARVTAREARATGATVTYGPTCDVARDPRWGRTFETFGESHTLCGELAAAAIAGYQHEDTLAATAKHFPAYSQPTRGEDTAPVDISPSTLRRVFLPPFEQAIEAGVETVMPCYNAVDGEPVHGSERFLREMLREELGFDGVVASDWVGVRHLYEDHHTARSMTDATRQTREATLDIASVDGPEHAQRVVDLVREGELSAELVDESVRRILSMKIRLGLFEEPYVDTERVTEQLRTNEHREAALTAAKQSLTLLDNDGTLPLDSESDVLVTGPNADSLRRQVGGWSVTDADPAGTTIRQEIEAHCEGEVAYEPGADIAEPRDIDAAAEAAADADAAVVVCGEGWYIHEFGGHPELTSDPDIFPARPELGLPEPQRDLLRAVQATGTPTILVLVSGRPLSTPWADEHCAATLMAYYPGSEGGQAVAETLFGEHTPSGTLPISVPRSTGHLPTHFDHRPHPHPVGEATHTPSYDPLYAFGHGLSYTNFVYGEVSLSAESIGPAGTLSVSVPVENTGEYDGSHAVDVFVRDEVSSRVTPVREHVGTARVAVDVGETETATVDIDGEQLAVVTGDGREVEPGAFTVLVGEDASALDIEREFTVESAY